MNNKDHEVAFGIALKRVKDDRPLYCIDQRLTKYCPITLPMKWEDLEYAWAICIHFFGFMDIDTARAAKTELIKQGLIVT